MRLALSPRGDRLLARLSRPSPATALEFVLLALIAVQCARLFWIAVTPVGPLGDWQPASALRPAGGTSSLDTFDPFFRIAAGSGSAVVTSLDLTLHGVREDRATGRGSAIIGLPGGEQRSFAVGEEILPGVVLQEVGFDSVTLLRNGAPEQVFLDQSAPAEAVGGEAPPQAAPPAAAAPAQPPVRFQPRMGPEGVNGFIVQPGANADALRDAGLVAGDVIVSVNGQRVTSAEQMQALAGGAEASLIVERGGRAVPIRMRSGR